MNPPTEQVERKLTKHSIEHLTSPNSDCENGSDGGPSSPKKEIKEHSEKVVSYTEMIAKAIFATQNNMSTLADIYNFLISKYPILKSRGKSWKNSVRHTLSLNEWFIKIPKLDNAKCCYWSIHPVYMQRFRKGDFQKQRKASVTKLRSHHNSHRYYDFGYDISPTMDYHFIPPPSHFQDVNSSISPHSAFSPWPISRSFDEFQNFFPLGNPQYSAPYPMYNPASPPATVPYNPYYPTTEQPQHHENNYFNYRQESMLPHPYEHSSVSSKYREEPPHYKLYRRDDDTQAYSNNINSNNTVSVKIEDPSPPC